MFVYQALNRCGLRRRVTRAALQSRGLLKETGACFQLGGGGLGEYPGAA